MKVENLFKQVFLKCKETDTFWEKYNFSKTSDFLLTLNKRVDALNKTITFVPKEPFLEQAYDADNINVAVKNYRKITFDIKNIITKNKQLLKGENIPSILNVLNKKEIEILKNNSRFFASNINKNFNKNPSNSNNSIKM